MIELNIGTPLKDQNLDMFKLHIKAMSGDGDGYSDDDHYFSKDNIKFLWFTLFACEFLNDYKRDHWDDFDEEIKSLGKFGKYAYTESGEWIHDYIPGDSTCQGEYAATVTAYSLTYVDATGVEREVFANIEGKEYPIKHERWGSSTARATILANFLTIFPNSYSKVQEIVNVADVLKGIKGFEHFVEGIKMKLL